MGKGSSALGKRDTGRSRKLPFEDGCPHFDLEGAGLRPFFVPKEQPGPPQLDPNRPPRQDPRLLPPSLLAATPGRRATGTPLPKFNTPFTLWRLSLRFLFRKEKAERTTDLPEVRRHDAACLDCSEYQDRDRHTYSSAPPAKPILIFLLVREPLQ